MHTRSFLCIALLTAALVAALGPLPAAAQGATDIFLVDLTATGNSPRFGTPVNITDRDGYDNQPFFMADGRSLLYTSIRDGQADVYQYSLIREASMPVTDTPESEYSPTPAPDGESFTVIRVEADSTQRLWRFPMNESEPSVVLPDLKPVGYQAWGDDHTVGLFVLGQPPTLQVADTQTGEVQVVARNVGRSLHKIPVQRALSFVEKTDSVWTLSRYDLPNGIVSPLTETLPGREDYAWLPDGTTVLMGDGAKLYAWEPEGDTWTEVADFSDAGVTTITRLAVSPDGRKLAFVSDRPAE